MARKTRPEVVPSSDVEIITKPVKKKSKKSSASTNGQIDAPPVASASSFFAPRPKLKPEAKATRDSPIVLTDSPKKPSTFAEYDAIRKEERKRKAALMQGYEPSLPKAYNMHVKGDQEASKSFGPIPTPNGSLSFLARTPRKRARVDSGYIERSGAVHSIVQNSPIASTSTLPASSAPDVSELESSHPLVQRVRKNVTLDDAQNREMWTVKYAPRTADEVLGSASRESAKMLRSWVKELALRKPDTDATFSALPKRHITRKADPTKKKRKRYDPEDEMDDFIVDDESDEDLRPPPAILSDDLAPPDTESQDAAQSPIQAHTFNNLTNLILLTGPPGSGKTCSVYAVAEELGFEVFEVSPGHGKRSYKDLLQAVGEVGRNHLVWKSGKAGPMGSVSSPKGKKPLASFFGAKPEIKTKCKGKEKEVVAEKESVKEKKEVSQSLILLEEVDILFQDDKSFASFWDGVVGIAANSMRPVILTCNDPKTIPYDRLAVQTILTFEAPEESEVLPYLQAVSSAEGHYHSEATLKDLYETELYRLPTNHPPSRIGLRPPASLITQSPTSADVRRCLTALQFWCDSETFAPTSKSAHLYGTNQVSDFSKYTKLKDVLSASDAYVSRRVETYLLKFDGDATPIEAERELEQIYLDIEMPEIGPSGLPEYLLDEEMHNTLSAMADVAFDGHCSSRSKEDQKLEDDRSALLSLMETMTNPLPLSAPLLPATSMFTDYIPFITSIVAEDDVQEANFNAAMQESKANNSSPPPLPGPIRSGARRSRRLNAEYAQEYERHLDLAPELLAVVRSVSVQMQMPL